MASPRASFARGRVVWFLLFAGACTRAGAVSVGDPRRGKAMITAVGCGACHSIDGVSGADGQFAPALTGVAGRTILAGKLPNTTENLMRWIKNPQAIEPGVAMPAFAKLGDQSIRDIAAYLNTLK